MSDSFLLIWVNFNAEQLSFSSILYLFSIFGNRGLSMVKSVIFQKKFHIIRLEGGAAK